MKKKMNLQNSLQANQNIRNQFQKATVLSESILQWNRKLVLIHREKEFPNEESKFEYHEEDFNKEQDKDSQPDIDLKDISKIDARDVGNRSSFLSEIKIN